MAYIGIKNENALYYFSSLRMRDDIAEKIPDADLYLDSGKEKALHEYGLTEADIKDGRLLIDKYYFDVMKLYYLGVKGTPFEGVYFFKTATVRDRVSKDFSNCVVSNYKDKILSEFGVTEDSVKDGGILMSKDAVDYIKGNRPSAKNRKIVNLDNPVKESSEKSDDVKKIDIHSKSVEVENKVESDKNEDKVDTNKSSNNEVKSQDVVMGGVNFLQSAIQKVLGSQPENDVIAVKMVDGSEYYITLRHIFYMIDESILSKCGYLDDEGKPQIKEDVVERMIDRGDIFFATPSQITYGANGVVRIRDCDDSYSPDLTHQPSGKYEVFHHFDDIILNSNQVVSVIGYPTFKDIAFPTIGKSNKLIYDYLKKKVKRGV